MNYGFDEDLVEIEPEAYVLGALPQTAVQPDGQWDEFLPVYEPQARLYETWSCTVYGSQNQIETYMKRVFGFEPNYDERYNVAQIQIPPGGTNPQKAYQSFRHDGLKDDEPDPDTYEEFMDKSYLTPKRIYEAMSWLDNYVLKHEWITDITKETIKDCLKYSPIAVSVTAWHEQTGLYVDNGKRNNHWCLCYGYIEDNEGIKLKIFDTYDKSHKLLHPDHRIAFAKRIWIYENTAPKLNWLQDLCKKLLSLFSIRVW